MPRVFISYNHKDAQVVDQLVVDLGTKFDIWIDKREIKPGVSLVEQVAEQLRECDYMIVVISTNSVQSRWVRKELGMADAFRVQIVPVVIDRSAVPSQIAHLPWFEIIPRSREYRDAVRALASLMLRCKLIGDRLILPLLTSWGGLKLTAGDGGSCWLSTSGSRGLGVSGLNNSEDPLNIVGFGSLIVEIANIDECRFEEKDALGRVLMLKVEINGRPVIARPRSLRVGDYIVPVAGAVEYKIPSEVRRRGSIKKLEFVFGRGRLKRLHLAVRFQ